MPSCSLTLLTQSRRREGLTSFPWRPLSESAYRASGRQLPYEAECSPARAPSAASPGRPSARRTQTAIDNRSSRSHPIIGRHLRPFVPAPATHPLGVALKQSLRPNASSAAWFPSFRSAMPSLLLAPSEGGRSIAGKLGRCRDERTRSSGIGHIVV